MTAQHCIAPPSSRARTVQCNGHVVMEQRAVARNPELAASSAESREGEAAHEVAEQLCLGVELVEGGTTSNGELITREMVEGARLWRDTIARDLAPHGVPLNAVALEVAVACNRIHPQVWGTPDARVWITPFMSALLPRPKIFVWDYKFGHGIIEVFECYQLTDYVSGALSSLNLPHDMVVDVEMVIVQPRAFHREGPVRRWRTDTTKLLHYFETSALAVHAALDTEVVPDLRVGPECEHCTARHECPALQRAAMNACDVSYKAQSLTLDAGARGLELRYLKRAMNLMEARVTGLEEEVRAGIRRGETTPGWSIESGQGRTVWLRPAGQVAAMGDELGFDLRKPVEVITPKQAADKGMPGDIVDVYSKSTSGAARLVENDGSRARQIFGGHA